MAARQPGSPEPEEHGCTALFQQHESHSTIPCHCFLVSVNLRFFLGGGPGKESRHIPLLSLFARRVAFTPDKVLCVPVTCASVPGCWDNQASSVERKDLFDELLWAVSREVCSEVSPRFPCS